MDFLCRRNYHNNIMCFKRLFAGIVIGAAIFSVCSAEQLPSKGSIRIESDDLYALFKNPDSKYRPYARWWWNGLRLDEKEIVRELDVMQGMGLGGVEINSIRFADEADTLGYKEMPYLSDDWARMVRLAAKECRERGMVCDMIGGSGWPFGGEFLPREHQLQMLTVETETVDGGSTGTVFSISKDDLLRRVDPPIMSRNGTPEKTLMYVRVMPRYIDKFTEGICYDNIAGDEILTVNIPAGKHVIYFFVKMTGYMNVIEGAPGACGPVLNHFDKDAVLNYLDRLSEKLDYTSPEMKGLIRAAFVDSFELEGANWCDDMMAEWEEYYGYPLDPYLPYIIRKVGTMGDPLPEDYGCEFSEDIKEDIVYRVRNDFEHFQIKLFKDNFLDTFNAWCHRNGLKSRIQAYGRALHPIESSMYIDIPECETWFRDSLGTAYPDKDIFTGHAHSMINKFVASGSLLAGNGLVSCEEITNTGEIFQSTLEEIKIAGDMSNVSGVNSSILHGFNYSPNLQTGFPGWIKYGEYFSEQNTMYPYYRLWTDYKARISAVLQNSVPQADVAILHPLEDMWSVLGQQRDPYPVNVYPDYAHDLWQNLHQNGNGCDYVSENIICRSKVRNGRLSFGPRSYKWLILMEVESMSPETAAKLEKFAASGGRILCIGKKPHKSAGFNDYEKKTVEVERIIGRIEENYPDRFLFTESPEGNLMEWYGTVQEKYGIEPYVKIDRPVKWVFWNYYKSRNRDIFFVTNFNSEAVQEFQAEFPAGVAGKQAWVWIPETGERYMLASEERKLHVALNPAESVFIVFDDETDGTYYTPLPSRPEICATVNGVWDVRAEHFNGSVKEFRMERLQDFNSLPFPWLRSFAGTVSYTTVFAPESPESISVIDLGKVRGVTELFVNGEKAGTCWYGCHRFNVTGMLKEGENVIKVKVVTPLGNYADSLTGNKAAKRYAHSKRSLGLEEDVKLY